MPFNKFVLEESNYSKIQEIIVLLIPDFDNIKIDKMFNNSLFYNICKMIPGLKKSEANRKKLQRMFNSCEFQNGLYEKIRRYQPNIDSTEILTQELNEVDTVKCDIFTIPERNGSENPQIDTMVEDNNLIVQEYFEDDEHFQPA